MSEWTQQFYLAATSSSTVQLSPAAHAGSCIRSIARPHDLAVAQLSITVVGDTVPTYMYPTTGCARYEVTVKRIN